MGYHNFKDSKGRELSANVYYDSGHGVDAMFCLEDAYYLDGEKEEVPADEIDDIYNQSGDPVNTAGMEGDL